MEEQELDGDGKVLNTIQKQRKQITAIEEVHDDVNATPQPSSCIRDSSRTQLHRLGALYSNPQDLSSPVHRTETAFAIEPENETRSATKLKKFNKLAELANSYNNFEDDTKNRHPKTTNSASNDVHTEVAAPKVNESKTVSGIKSIVKSPRKPNEKIVSGSILNRIETFDKKEADDNKNLNNKKLNWDKSIMDSLESQGFKRRDTTTKRLEYDFKEQTDGREINHKALNASKPPSGATASVGKGAVPKSDTKQQQPLAKQVEVTKGLVSGRAAIFETGASRAPTAAASSTANNAKNQKDPAEMSLKERLALFEKNKGNAPLPKGSIGIGASVKQIMADKKPSENVRQVVTTPQQPMVSSTVTSVGPSPSKINNFNKATKAETAASGTGIRQTVAALLSAPATISESRIAQENRKIREQEMNVVLNRFNNKVDDQPSEPAAPPPAPPMPDQLFKTNSNGRKRLSGKY